MMDFINELKSYYSDQAVFNPWRDYSKQLDIGPDAPKIRTNHLQRFLEPRISDARYIFVAEALGFQGGHFSGIPMTSERIVIGNHSEVDYHYVFKGKAGSRTSNPITHYPGFKKSWGKEGISEQTATIVWKTILENHIDPYEIILWNIFPFHPYRDERGLLSNRPPKSKELELGVYFFNRLLNHCPKNIKVICIGKHSKKTLDQHGIKNLHITHPANGRAPAFKEGCRKIFSINDRLFK
ncbi:uracil-DNA glycosylase [Neobacillus sp. WH10]|uniref:uracil-DNA glycosylase n=1 Tax=Neobacillus sp. WH10 TaxID=3047873 RepID=UPI0024C18ED2|nr:uracil-DNA glycosylase [Neobacillus sp. WH10]WHY79933.1 uracil-DNA glycosylase [Neobacillus sp. WH10]